MGWAIALHHNSPGAQPSATSHVIFGSLASKLTLAFLLVGVVGVLVFALMLGQRTRMEFVRFLSDRDQALMLEALTNYYAENGDWAGVRRVLAVPPLNSIVREIILVNADGVVILTSRAFQVGDHLALNSFPNKSSIVVNGQTVGHVVWLMPDPEIVGFEVFASRPPAPLVVAFWARILRTAIASGGITILLALLLGWLLARTLTAPVRELTKATEAMAAGDFSQRVNVVTQDEIGNLARSFNQMSADLARASQLRKQMTADLAHDLRTPLTILRGYLEGLKDKQLQGTTELYTLMHQEVLHLQRLVDDLRVLSLADTGELPLNRRIVDPTALLERTGLLYFVAAERQGIRLRVAASENLPSILVDTDRITQVLNNLVSNALRHTTSGEIVLSAQAIQAQAIEGQVTQEAVALSVRDSGSGITAEDLPFVFDRFYRGDKSRHRSEIGTGIGTELSAARATQATPENVAESTDSASSGLGLAIAKAIVETHGGTIQVESTVGTGSTFTIVLPVAEQQPILPPM